MELDEFVSNFEGLRKGLGQFIVGQDDVVVRVLIGMLARGHVLLEGAPGLGKTLLVRMLAQLTGCSFRRIQFTPDLMPSDVTGSSVFNQKADAFEFVPGPVFAQLVLADEINRAPAKTQSALLEAMQEQQVTVDGVSRGLPQPFFVLATQNPVESQGTYPLPEAQLDRFMLKVLVGYPSLEAERGILKLHLGGFDPSTTPAEKTNALSTAASMQAMQAFAAKTRVDATIETYILEVVRKTREHRGISLGASPRASIALLKTAQVLAASEGRGYVIPDDVKALAPAVLRHRITLHPDAEIQGITPDECVRSILHETPTPKVA